MFAELEEYKEISTNRLTELEKLTSEHQDALTEVEKLKMDVCFYSYKILIAIFSSLA